MAKKKKKIDSYKERIIVLQRYATGETPEEIAENGNYELDDVNTAVASAKVDANYVEKIVYVFLSELMTEYSVTDDKIKIIFATSNLLQKTKDFLIKNKEGSEELVKEDEISLDDMRKIIEDVVDGGSNQN